MNQRILIALVAALAVQISLGEIMGRLIQSQGYTQPALVSSLIALLASLIGGFIARRGFTFPALGLQLAYYGASFAILAWIAGTQGGDDSIVAVALENWQLLSLGLIATAAGSLAGQRLASGLRQPSAS